MHPNSKLLFERYALSYFSTDSRVLEIGPDTPSIYQELAPGRWDTADLKGSHEWGFDRSVTLEMPDEYTLPVGDATYDIVFSGQVLEHVRQIWVWVRELTRVIVPSGLLITIAPWSWPYHAVPVDCWRVHEEGMRALYEYAGLEVLEVHSEALEPAVTRRIYPGSTPAESAGLSRHVRRLLGWPAPNPIDTIGIGKKTAYS